MEDKKQIDWEALKSQFFFFDQMEIDCENKPGAWLNFRAQLLQFFHDYPEPFGQNGCADKEAKDLLKTNCRIKKVKKGLREIDQIIARNKVALNKLNHLNVEPDGRIASGYKKSLFEAQELKLQLEKKLSELELEKRNCGQ